jgi:hypothetical protein
MEKRGRGRPKGCVSHMKGVTGARHYLSKFWDLYHDGTFIGTYKGFDEISEMINRSKARCWQMARGYNGGFKTTYPVTSIEGYTILEHGAAWGWWKED